MFESSVADRANLAGHDPAFKSFVSTEGSGGHVGLPAPIAGVLGLRVLGVPSSLVPVGLATVGELAP